MLDLSNGPINPIKMVIPKHDFNQYWLSIGYNIEVQRVNYSVEKIICNIAVEHIIEKKRT